MVLPVSGRPLDANKTRTRSFQSPGTWLAYNCFFLMAQITRRLIKNSSRPPLLFAAENGHENTVRMLLQGWSQSEATEQTGRDGVTQVVDVGIQEQSKTRAVHHLPESAVFTCALPLSFNYQQLSLAVRYQERCWGLQMRRSHLPMGCRPGLPRSEL